MTTCISPRSRFPFFLSFFNSNKFVGDHNYYVEGQTGEERRREEKQRSTCMFQSTLEAEEKDLLQPRISGTHWATYQDALLRTE